MKNIAIYKNYHYTIYNVLRCGVPLCKILRKIHNRYVFSTQQTQYSTARLTLIHIDTWDTKMYTKLKLLERSHNITNQSKVIELKDKNYTLKILFDLLLFCIYCPHT